MKYLIIGLGNPGAQYTNTRHNIGFLVLDALAKEYEVTYKMERHAEYTEVKYKGRTLVLIKPTTFMNLSGKAVSYWMQQFKLPIENVMVITDDLALPFGKLRMKGKGSDGGHNGLKSIQAAISPNYARLRFGVGNEFDQGRQVDYVLGNWNEDEAKLLPERLLTATEFIKAFSTIGLELTMTNWNNK
jgi:peptidyl-tRNA hydrolase, PTH1 family